MNENEEAKDYLEKLFETSPKNFIESIDDKSRGTYVLLKALSGTEKEVCAGDISKAFGVSTARVAVVIKKLAEKGFVETAADEEDKRRVIIRITEAGREEVRRNEGEMIDYIKILVKEVGASDMNEFLRIFAKINKVLDKLRNGLRKNIDKRLRNRKKKATT